MKISLLFSCSIAFATCKDLLFNNDSNDTADDCQNLIGCSRQTIEELQQMGFECSLIREAVSTTKTCLMYDVIQYEGTTYCGKEYGNTTNCRENGDVNSYCIYGHHCGCSIGFVCDGKNYWGILNGAGDCAAGVSCIPSKSAMRCADCNGCQIGDECVGYDPSGTYGPPDEKTCRIHGVDCSGVPDDSKTCKAEKMDCGARSPGDGYFLGKRNCCDGLTCISLFGRGQCEKEHPPCHDFGFNRDCHNPGWYMYNGTRLNKSYLELFPDGCRQLPKNHGIWELELESGEHSLKGLCPKSCGCKKCNYFNRCIE